MAKKKNYALAKQRKLKYFASRNSQDSNKDNTVIPNIIWNKGMKQHLQKNKLNFVHSQ